MNKACINTETKANCETEEGFVSFDSLLAQFPRECSRFGGELFLVEISYRKQTALGGPRGLPATVESIKYVLGVVLPKERHNASYPAWVVPTDGIVQWGKYERWNIAEQVEQEGQLNLYALNASHTNDDSAAWYRFAVSDDAVEAFLEQLSGEQGSNNDSILVFWNAAKLLGHELSSGVPSVVTALEQERNKAIKDYVHSKARIFVDKLLGPGEAFSDNESVPAGTMVCVAHLRLTDLGLDEDAIRYRAREYAMSGMELE